MTETTTRAEPSWIIGYEANVSPFESKAHVHCARCGAREPFTLENIAAVVRPFIDDHRKCQLSVWPENFWREVWHDGCVKRGPMRGHRQETLTIEDGSTLTRFECLGCGVNCYAGLDTQRHIVTRPYPAVSPETAQPFCSDCGAKMDRAGIVNHAEDCTKGDLAVVISAEPTEGR